MDVVHDPQFTTGRDAPAPPDPITWPDDAATRTRLSGVATPADAS